MITSVLPVYNRNPLELDRGEGSHLITKDGTRYLDFVTGVAVNCLGHCHPKLVSALKEQSEKLWHVSNIFKIPGMDDFASALTSKTFADTVFFCNSGAEAVECCIKMVRKYHDANNNPEKYRIITFTGAFHGRTLAALWASKRDKMMQEGFGPPVEGFDNVPFGDLQAVRDAITPETGAILVEPIQGDGGIRPCTKEYLQGLRDIADEHGLLLCCDEIQCGMGRSGKLYAHEHYDIKPDILTSAKGIGGGFPLGACLATAEAAKGMTAGSHGSTYGGNPLAMAVGRAVLSEVSSEEFLDSVTQNSAFFMEKLQGLQKRYQGVIGEVRGLGYILGLQTIVKNTDFIDALRTHGLIAPAASDNIVRLLPPLNISKADLEHALEIIETCCKEFAA